VRATKNYSIPDETKNRLFDKGGFAAPTPSDTPLPYLYFDVAGISITTPQVPPPQRYSSWGVHSILRGVRGLFSSSKVVPPTVGLSWTEGKLRLPEDSNGRQIAAVYPIGSPLALVSWPAFFGIVVLGATFLVVAWARRTLAGADAAERRSVGDTIKEIEGMARTSIAAKQPPRANQAVLVIGAPRAAKDGVARRAVVDASGSPPEHRIDLLNLKLTPWWTSAELEKIDALKMKDEQRLLWIHVANLETQLVDAESRAELFRLLEGLFRFKADEHTRVASLVVTSTIDPIAHFTDVFVEERQQIYANAVPEVELNRSSLLLSRFRRCYVPLVGRNPWPKWFCYHPRKWRIVLRRETSSHLLLDSIGRDIAAAWKDVKAVSSEDLRSAVLSRAEACYQLLWTSCTRSEKLVLIQLAQEGLVNPKNRETLDELVAKGLVLTGPVPTLFNITFRDFLQGIERSSVVQEWERTEGTGLWMMAGRLAASVLVVGGVFYLITQGFAVQSVLPIISGSGLLGIPLVKDLVSRVSTPKDGAARLS